MTSHSPVPLKCTPETAANVPDNPCRPPGSKPRCVICPASPNYHRRDEAETSEGRTQ